MTGMVPFADRYRCTALAKGTGERCRRSAHPGAAVCVMHGGGSPKVKASARRRLEVQRAEAKLGRLMVELEGESLSGRHPLEVLHDVVSRADAMVHVLGALLGKLDPDEDGSPGRTLIGANHLGDLAPHVLATMYEAALDRAGRLAKAAIELDLEDRFVQLQEYQMDLMADIIRGVLHDLGRGMHEPVVQEIVKRHLRGAPSIEAWEVSGGD